MLGQFHHVVRCIRYDVSFWIFHCWLSMRNSEIFPYSDNHVSFLNCVGFGSYPNSNSSGCWSFSVQFVCILVNFVYNLTNPVIVGRLIPSRWIVLVWLDRMIALFDFLLFDILISQLPRIQCCFLNQCNILHFLIGWILLSCRCHIFWSCLFNAIAGYMALYFSFFPSSYSNGKSDCIRVVLTQFY